MKKFILSYDTFVALIATMAAIMILPDTLSNEFSAKVYSIGINVLSIIFSVFFASLAVIVANPDNSFITFIEQHGLFSRILVLFKITLLALFISLVLTIVLYIYAELNLDYDKYSKEAFCFFVFLFSYSLVATAMAVNTTLQLTIRRTRYINNQAAQAEQQQNENNGQ